MKATPGPWELGAGRVITTLDAGEFYITYGADKHRNPLWKSSFSELDANARLVAAAPELLEELKNAVGYVDGDIVDAARAAIAAKEGKC